MKIIKYEEMSKTYPVYRVLVSAPELFGGTNNEVSCLIDFDINHAVFTTQTAFNIADLVAIQKFINDEFEKMDNDDVAEDTEPEQDNEETPEEEYQRVAMENIRAGIC